MCFEEAEDTFGQFHSEKNQIGGVIPILHFRWIIDRDNGRKQGFN